MRGDGLNRIGRPLQGKKMVLQFFFRLDLGRDVGGHHKPRLAPGVHDITRYGIRPELAAILALVQDGRTRFVCNV